MSTATATTDPDPVATVVDDAASQAAEAAQTEATKAAKAAAKAEAAKAKAAAAAEAAEAAKVAAAIRDQHVGTKVANTFGRETYLGTVTSARTHPDTHKDYYQVTYSDGDQEELELKEVEAANERYKVVLADMWDLMIKLVGLDEAGVAALQAQGITSVVELELFGGSAAAGNAFDAIPGLSFMTKQHLSVVATFLLNDGILTPTSTMAEVARFNLAQQNGTNQVPPPPATRRPRKKPAPSTPNKRKTKTAVKAATPKAKPKGGRPKKTTKSPGRPKKKTTTKAAASPKRGRPKKSA